MTPLYLHFPHAFDDTGRTALCPNSDEHIREMIEQVLFTNPGERLNRPDFGCGVMQTVFAPNSDQLAAALQVNIQAALQRWLGDVIGLQTLTVTHEDSTLAIVLDYVVIRTGQLQNASFARSNVL